METYKVNGISPFVPAKDYELSYQFYKDLGFTEVLRLKNKVHLKISSFGFWLQDYYMDTWANNFLLCMYVEDLDKLWSHIQKMDLDNNYNATTRIISPPMQDNGYIMKLVDPSSVLWYLRQSD